MGKIIQIIQGGGLNGGESLIYGLDDEGVIWTLSDSQFGIQWNRKIGSPNNSNVSNPLKPKSTEKTK